MDPLGSLTIGDWGGLILGGISIITSISAVTLALRSDHTNRINTNSWETYRTYNSKDIRRGRALALEIVRDTNGQGFTGYEDYRRYFSLDSAPATTATTSAASAASAASTPAPSRSQQRQYLHDLASFYHQTGLLLTEGRLDKDFTLLLVGPGLHDRWNVLRPLAGFYEHDTPGTGVFPYGGMYALYMAYLKWNRGRFARLRRTFQHARAEADRLRGA